MTTIETIAELVWREFHPGGPDDAMHSKAEYVETAKNIWAGLAWELSMQAKQTDDASFFSSMVEPIELEVKKDDRGYYVCIDRDILDIPHDAGIQLITSPYERFTKGNIASSNIFNSNFSTGKSYYRLQHKIYFPQGFTTTPKNVTVYAITLDSKTDDDKTGVQRSFADVIARRLRQAYLPTSNKQEDKTTDSNPNT